MEEKNKIKEFFKDLLYSTFKTDSLFKFAIYKWYTPVIIFILISVISILNPIINYNKLTSETVTKNISYIDKVFTHVLSQDINCSIKDSKLTCDDEYSELYVFNNANDDTIKYQIYINYNITEDVTLNVGEFGEHFDTDNYLIFFEESFRYRYTYHNPKTQQVEEYLSLGTYDQLNGMDFHQIYTESLDAESQENYLLEVAHTIILEGYKSLAIEVLYINIASNIGMYFLFLLIISLLLKGNYLLRKKKGFKYTQALKISVIASIQSVLIALVLSLLGIDFINAFCLALTIRILYIYIRYTGSRKNTQWLQNLYTLTNDERFNI